MRNYSKPSNRFLLFSLAFTGCAFAFQQHKAWNCLPAESGSEQTEPAIRLQPTSEFNKRLLLEEKQWQRRLNVGSEIFVIPADNAFAVPQGNVLLGQRLANRYLSAHDAAYALQALAYVAAHEYGHELQFRLRGDQVAASAATELQADALAGYWIGMRLREQVEDGAASTQDAQKIIQLDEGAAFDIGDYLFDSPTHHGTPAQRHAAVAEGIKSGYERKVGAIFQSTGSANRLYYETQAIVVHVME